MRRVRQELIHAGKAVSDIPDASVTHLILGVPSLEDDGTLKNGGPLPCLLDVLPKDITVIGGNLSHDALKGYPVIDLLKSETYLWENAAITADCAIYLARQRMHCRWKDAKVLIAGFGRIGFHLALTLRSLGADVTIAARKAAALAQAKSLELDTRLTDGLDPSPYTVIFNTVPEMLLPEQRCIGCDPNCIKMDLASRPGIGGSGVIWARGLPGKYAPESSGALIANMILQAVN